MRLILILIALALTACADDKKVGQNNLTCNWYEIGSWQFEGLNDDVKSTFSDCGQAQDGSTLVKVQSVDGKYIDFISAPYGYELPAGTRGGGYQ